jgi:hypothetical protein
MRISEDEHTEIMGPEIAKMSGGARQAETCSGHLQRKQFLEFKDRRVVVAPYMFKYVGPKLP